MTRLQNRCRLTVEALEERSTPAAGTYVEDFTNDYRPSKGGYDSDRDGLKLAPYEDATFGDYFFSSPPGGPAGLHSLRLIKDPYGNWGAYQVFINHSTRRGDLAPWEQVTAASVMVRGNGWVTFTGETGSINLNPDSGTDWVTYSVTSGTLGIADRPLGQILGIQVVTPGEIDVDDLTVTVTVKPGAHDGDNPGEVRVSRFGNGLGIVGDKHSNGVRIELPYDKTVDGVDDDSGTIRVVGFGGTKITSRTPEVIQISDYVVEVPHFTHKLSGFDRDVLVNLRGGDDQLLVTGSEWSNLGDVYTIDHLVINVSSGDSLTEIHNLALLDGLLFQSTAGADTLLMNGHTRLAGIKVITGAGTDEVRIGTPGAKVYDGDDPGEVHIKGESPYTDDGVVRLRNWINTGPGDDKVNISGGHYENFSVYLGSGADKIRFESMEGNSLNVYSGAGDDLIEICESIPTGIYLYQDNRDALRLHRITGSDVDAYRIRLIRGSGIQIQLPASGTQMRYVTGAAPWDFNPPDATGMLGVLLGEVLGLSPEDRRRRLISVIYAGIDF